MRLLPTALLLSPVLLLAACGDEPEVVTGDDSREASGEILEGSISDSMLPLDKVRSQAPLMTETPSAEADGSAEIVPADTPGEEPQPTSEPAASAEPAAETAE